METERRRRASVEVKLAAHETRRANAVESLIARERRRGERAIRSGERGAPARGVRTSFTAELRRGRDRDAANAAEAVHRAATPNQAAAFAASASVASVADASGLTSAEEDLVALEAEHQRERDHLRGELVSARAEMAAGIVAANDAREDAAAARAGNAAAARADVNRVYDGLRRADRGLGVGGARAVLVALRALDALEGRAVGVYKVAAGALDLCRRACDAAEDALDDVESAAERDATENLEEGVERIGASRGRPDRGVGERAGVPRTIRRRSRRGGDARRQPRANRGSRGESTREGGDAPTVAGIRPTQRGGFASVHARAVGGEHAPAAHSPIDERRRRRRRRRRESESERQRSLLRRAVVGVRLREVLDGIRRRSGETLDGGTVVRRDVCRSKPAKKQTAREPEPGSGREHDERADAELARAELADAEPSEILVTRAEPADIFASVRVPVQVTYYAVRRARLPEIARGSSQN